MYERVFRNGVFENFFLEPADLATSYLYHKRAQLLEIKRRTKKTLEISLRCPSIENSTSIVDSVNEDWGDYSRDQIIVESRQELKDLGREMLLVILEYKKVAGGNQQSIDEYSNLEKIRRNELKKDKNKANGR